LRNRPPSRPGGSALHQSSTPREAKRGASPANDGRKLAIVTARKPRGGRGFSDASDLTPEELQRRGDAADALWRELIARLLCSRGEAPSQALDECFQRAS